MSDTDTTPCGCCTGTTRQTPLPIWNRPGLSQIAYRVGTHARFKASLLAALSDPAFPALAPLATRDDSDFSIALLDAFAVTADILTFYQERLANESYLRTAAQPRSVFELARLVGYVPSPGVAAGARLAFTLNDAPGAPDPVVIPAGTRVQSVPAPGQSPATFETGTDLTARIGYNAMPAVTADPVDWTGVTTSLWLDGTSTGLNPGDAIVFIDAGRTGNPGLSDSWDFHFVTATETDATANRTRLTWDSPLSAAFQAAAQTVRLYALRKRAALFGVNAPDPTLLPAAATTSGVVNGDWKYTSSANTVDLDASEFATAPQKFTWIVLSLGTTQRLYGVTQAYDRSPRSYTLTSKATELILDDDTSRSWFVTGSRSAVAFVQSEPLAIAPQPLTAWSDTALDRSVLAPVAGDAIRVAASVPLAQGASVAVSGKRSRLRLDSAGGASLVGSDGRTAIPIEDGDVFLVDAYPPAGTAGGLAWSVLTTKGVAGTLTAPAGAVTLLASDKADAEVSEGAVVDAVVARTGETTLAFKSKLARIYDRLTVRVNANVVAATHGETVKEILGSADGSAANQSFALKQMPLTFVSASGGQGAQTTLDVWVNDMRWHEQPNLLDAAARDRVFMTRRRDDGGVVVQFGDGVHGARPPTGQTNVRATYRKGLGRAGMVAAGQISQAIDRPAGLKGVANPDPSSGGADPDTPEDARRSAPLHILTLDRVVSLQDYQDQATAFAGVGRALATWTWFGRTRGVVVTVAGPGGVGLDPAEETIGNLATTLRSLGNAYIPIAVVPHQPKLFRAEALVRIATADFDPALVLAAARAALLSAFGFDARGLAQGVAQSEVIAAIQPVAGVVGVRLTRFTRADVATLLPEFLPASAPQSGPQGTILGAEMLLVDPLSVTSLELWP
jgi:Baseplate J-like protein